MKLDAIGGDSFEKCNRLIGVLISLFGESDQELGVPRLGQELAFPFRLGEIFKSFSARPLC